MIKTIAINHDNFETFLHKGLAWTHQLNADIDIKLTNGMKFSKYKNRAIFIEFYDTPSSFNEAYMYPDEDICLYKDFPHRQLVFPSIVFAETFKKKTIKCTCSLLWLIQHGKMYLNKNMNQYDTKAFLFYPEGFEHLSARACLKIKNFETILNECNFTQRFERCPLKMSQGLSQELTFKGKIFILDEIILKTVCI